MKQIKGSLFKRTVVYIRANKSKRDVYDSMLSEEAKKLVYSRLMDPLWYPFDVYKECFNALCKVEANNDRDVIFEWGQMESEFLMTSLYKSSIKEGSVSTTLERYNRWHKHVHTFGEVLSEYITSNRVVVTFKDFEPDFENFYYIATGWLAKFIELCTGEKPSDEFLKKSWLGAPDTQILFTWSVVSDPSAFSSVET
ncbi:MAG: hypothetical protein ACFFD4_21520 [Candidatus Odinarchaeota archaeon]